MSFKSFSIQEISSKNFGLKNNSDPLFRWKAEEKEIIIIFVVKNHFHWAIGSLPFSRLLPVLWTVSIGNNEMEKMDSFSLIFLKRNPKFNEFPLLSIRWSIGLSVHPLKERLLKVCINKILIVFCWKSRPDFLSVNCRLRLDCISLHINTNRKLDVN